jgi:membrane dipeptidase
MPQRNQPPDGVSQEANALHMATECIDLHLDGFIWHRFFGYDLHKSHGTGPLAGHFGGHLDFPRSHAYGLNAGGWSITTNPFRSAQGRWRTFQRNLDRFEQHVTRAAVTEPVVIARDIGEYRHARPLAADTEQRGKLPHVVLPAIQGANALEGAPNGPASIRDRLITRATLVHLTNSCYGVTSAPINGMRRGDGLTAKGKALVEQLDAERIFVDLAHINPAGFWDAVAVHDKSLPLIVTHTGVTGVRPHWRNIDDEQIKAIADTGGVVGVIFQLGFLRAKGGASDGEMIVEHLQHIIDVAGEDFAAIGSDYDGMISPPGGMRREPAYARLVQWMLNRGWSDERIAKILGANFLRSFAALRPAQPSITDAGEPEHAAGAD